MWPETSVEEILSGLAAIEEMIKNLKPGEWCDEECSNALHHVVDCARKARIIVQKKAGLAHDPVT